jgi:hypothetical protein
MRRLSIIPGWESITINYGRRDMLNPAPKSTPRENRIIVVPFDQDKYAEIIAELNIRGWALI